MKQESPISDGGSVNQMFKQLELKMYGKQQ